MTTCPVCGCVMSPLRRGRPRTYCGTACAVVGSGGGTEVDEVAVRRLVTGELVTSTLAERLEACRILRARGRSYTQVAEVLRVTPHTIWRYVVQLRNEKEAA